MKEILELSLSDPTKLENLYRSDKSGFRKAFFELFPTKPTEPIAICWFERLQEESSSISWGKGADLLVILAATALATFIAKIPDFFFFKARRVFPSKYQLYCTAYFIWLFYVDA